MPRRGARELAFQTFRGVCYDVSPQELPDALASDCSNVEFDGEAVRKRRGRAKYNATAMSITGGNSPVVGAGVYYPSSGIREVILAVTSGVGGVNRIYSDRNQDGDFSDAGETLFTHTPSVGSPAHVEMLQHKDRMYILSVANTSPTLRVWNGSSLRTAGNLTPPGAPTAALVQTVLEDFGTASDWKQSTAFTFSLTDSTGASSAETVPRQGTNCLKMTLPTSTGNAGKGRWIKKAFSAGATVDLSKLDRLRLWVYSPVAGPSFRVAIYKDGDTVGATGTNPVTTPNTTLPEWEKFPVHKIKPDQRGQWVAVDVPLSGVPPTSRTAVPGIAIQFISDGGRGFNKAIDLYFDDCKGVGLLTPTGSTAKVSPTTTVGSGLGDGATPTGEAPAADHRDYYSYRYSYVYKSGDIALEESAMSDEAIVHYLEDVPITGVALTVVDSAETGREGVPTHIRVYRKRALSALPGWYMVAEETNAAGTITDTMSEGDLAIRAVTGRSPRGVLFREDPPDCRTMALVGSRLFLGYERPPSRPYRVWVSRFNDVEEFSPISDPEDPLSAGWLDLPDRDPIQRIVEFNGMALVFTTRAVWSIEGSSFTPGDPDQFRVRKRADVGIESRLGVVTADRLVYYLAADGVRVIVPSQGTEGEFASWIISEPIESKLREIPAAARSLAAMGVDHRGRLLLSCAASGETVNTRSFLFDPRIPGAMERGLKQTRPGWAGPWTIGFSCFANLQRGVSVGSYRDQGQLLGGDTATGTLWYVGRSSADADLETDDGSAIAWSWTSKAIVGPRSDDLQPSFAQGVFDAASGASVTVALLDAEGSSLGSGTLSLGSASTGQVRPTPKRWGPATRKWQVRLKLSGEQSVPLVVREAVLGVYVR